MIILMLEWNAAAYFDVFRDLDVAQLEVGRRPVGQVRDDHPVGNSVKLKK